jgi:hypothetical protein
VPAARLCHVPWRLLRVVRCEERCNFVITEEITQPRARWQVVDFFCSTFFPVWERKPPIRTAGRTALAVGVLVVRELLMFAVDESHAVVWTCFYFHYTTFADFFEEFLGQREIASVVVRWQEEYDQLVDRFGRSIGNLHKTNQLVRVWGIERKNASITLWTLIHSKYTSSSSPSVMSGFTVSSV